MGEGQLRREGGKFGLLYASLGAIVGSGWLFGPLHAAQQAGPSPWVATALRCVSTVRFAPWRSAR